MGWRAWGRARAALFTPPPPPFPDLKIARRDAHVVLLARVVKLGQPPVDEPQRARRGVDHHVVRFHVPVHHPARVAKVEGEQELVHVVAHVGVGEGRVEDLEVGGVDVLEHERRRLGRGVAHAVEQGDDVGPPAQRLQDLDLPLDLFLLDRFEDFDHAFGAVCRVHAFEHFRVFAAADLADDLIVVLGAERREGGGRGVGCGVEGRCRHPALLPGAEPRPPSPCAARRAARPPAPARARAPPRRRAAPAPRPPSRRLGRPQAGIQGPYDAPRSAAARAAPPRPLRRPIHPSPHPHSTCSAS